MDYKVTIEKAKEASKNAYVPYSDCHVGCAIAMKNEDYVLGCNVENASYGLSNCAERTAIFSMVAKGYHKEDIDHIALVSDFKGDTRPCGACRQVFAELVPVDAPIYMLNKDGSICKMTIRELLPESFSKEDLK